MKKAIEIEMGNFSPRDSDVADFIFDLMKSLSSDIRREKECDEIMENPQSKRSGQDSESESKNDCKNASKRNNTWDTYIEKKVDHSRKAA